MMALVSEVERWWVRLQWPLYVALFLSILSLLDLSAVTGLGWLNIFAVAGVFVALAVAKVSPNLNVGLVFFIGFAVNIAVWALFIYGLSRIVVRLRQGRDLAK
jgi:hypothetical protein